MSARSDQTLVCVGCKLRFARLAGGCPGCGKPGEELRDAATRSKLVEALRKSAPGPRLPLKLLLGLWIKLGALTWKGMERIYEPPGKKLWLGWPVLALPMVIMVLWALFEDGVRTSKLLWSPVVLLVGMALGMVMAMTMIFGFYMAAACIIYLPALVGLAVLRLLEWLAWERPRARGPRPFVVALAPAEPARAGERVRGRVRCAAPLDSPLGACAAWRLAGEGESGPIDDAAVAGFEVVDERGEVIAVFDGNATVEIDASEPVTPPLALADEVSLAGGQPVSLRAGALRDGDEVEVEGPCDEAAAAGSGYRDARFLRRYAEKPGEAVTIRQVRRERVLPS